MDGNQAGASIHAPRSEAHKVSATIEGARFESTSMIEPRNTHYLSGHRGTYAMVRKHT